MSHVGEQLGLLQGYYHFLLVGSFVGEVMKSNDLSEYTDHAELSIGKAELDTDKISMILSDIARAPDKENVSDYMVLLNGLRGILMTMRDAMDGSVRFRDHVAGVLGKQFFPFDQLTRFLRNVFVHQTSTRLLIHNTTIVDQMLFLQSKDISEIVFSIDTGRLAFVDTYLTTIHIRVDFSRLKHKTKLYDVIELTDIYALCCLCYDIAATY